MSKDRQNDQTFTFDIYFETHFGARKKDKRQHMLLLFHFRISSSTYYASIDVFFIYSKFYADMLR